jgi:hypothetical protein
MSNIMAYFYGFIDLKEYIRRRKMQEPETARASSVPLADERVK